jgi:hypothetical protein
MLKLVFSDRNHQKKKLRSTLLLVSMTAMIKRRNCGQCFGLFSLTAIIERSNCGQRTSGAA